MPHPFPRGEPENLLARAPPNPLFRRPLAPPPCLDECRTSTAFHSPVWTPARPRALGPPTAKTAKAKAAARGLAPPQPDNSGRAAAEVTVAIAWAAPEMWRGRQLL